jgi:hypothetical protein
LRRDGVGPARVTFAVGGAGAQAEIIQRALPGLAPRLREGRLRLTLVAGVRGRIAAYFRVWLERYGLADHVEILHEPDHRSYFRRFHALLAETDILWTKPSEMTFFAALGLPLVLAPPVGDHERCNQRWAVEAGAGCPQGEPDVVGSWLLPRIDDGTFADMAVAGFERLPNLGTYRILDALVEDGVLRLPEAQDSSA